MVKGHQQALHYASAAAESIGWRACAIKDALYSDAGGPACVNGRRLHVGDLQGTVQKPLLLRLLPSVLAQSFKELLDPI